MGDKSKRKFIRREIEEITQRPTEDTPINQDTDDTKPSIKKSIDTIPEIAKITVQEEPDLAAIVESTKRKPGRPKGSLSGNHAYKKEKREKEKALKKLWNKGILHWKLDSSQMDLYRDYYDTSKKRCCWTLSRQTGKTWTVCTIAMEEAKRHPKIRMAYIAPELNDAKDLTEQTFDQLCEDAPDEDVPKFNTQKNRWEWKNGSTMKVVGTDNKNYKKIRGRKYERIFMDEFGFMDEFKKVFFTCVKPTTTSVEDYKIVFISTPPETADHESNLIIDDAEFNQTLITKTIYDCPRFSDRYIDENILIDYRQLGGRNSVEFRREYMAERIADVSKLVLPEANEDKIPQIVRQVKRPEFYSIFEGYDWGVLDNNAGLFAYVDYDSQVLVIEDEMFLDGIHNTTEDIAHEIKKISKELWGDFSNTNVQRYCDNNLQLVNDLSITYGINMIATKKDGLQAAINHVRKLIANKQIVINPKCKHLIAQIQSATWQNDKRKEFSRRNGHHYDLVAALIYLVRNANMSINPFPEDYGIPKDGSYFISPKKKRKEHDAFAEHLAKVFTVKRRKRR